MGQRERRNFLRAGLALSATWAVPGKLVHAATAAPNNLLPNPSEFKRVMGSFIGKSKVSEEGLKIDLPTLADNPSGVPLGVQVTYPISESSYCQELVVLAELNPVPLAGRFQFFPLAGTAEVAMRLRLSQSQTVHVLAKMSDGRVLQAKQHITVATSGCGM